MEKGEIFPFPTVFSKLTDSNFSVAQMVQFFFGRVEKIAGKGENADYHTFYVRQERKQTFRILEKLIPSA